MTITVYTNHDGEKAGYLTKDINILSVTITKMQGEIIDEKVYPDTTHNRTCILNNNFSNLKD